MFKFSVDKKNRDNTLVYNDYEIMSAMVLGSNK